MDLKQAVAKIIKEVQHFRRMSYPVDLAAAWASGEGSFLDVYSENGVIPNENFRKNIVDEIIELMDYADPDGVDELKQLLAHITEQPIGIDEAYGWFNRETGQEEWQDVADDSDISDLYLSPEQLAALNEPKSTDDRIVAKPKLRREGSTACEGCGGTKNEGTCECSINEKDTIDHVEIGSRAEVGGPTANIESRMREGFLDRVKSALTADVGGPEFLVQPAGRATAHGKTKTGVADPKYTKWLADQEKMRQAKELASKASKKVSESDGDECPECNGPPGKHDPKCPLKNESVLRNVISGVIKEMKLGLDSSGGAFSFDRNHDKDDEDIATFLLTKKSKEEKEASVSKKSGTKLSTSRKSSKSSKFR